MNLVVSLRKEMFEAKRNRDDVKSSILSLVVADIANTKISKGQDLKEEDVIDVLRKYEKKLKEAYEIYENSGRDDLATIEKVQLQIIQEYLPQLMSEEEVKAFVVNKIGEMNIEIVDIGKLMGVIMPMLKGKADGSIVNKVVRDISNK